MQFAHMACLLLEDGGSISFRLFRRHIDDCCVRDRARRNEVVKLCLFKGTSLNGLYTSSVVSEQQHFTTTNLVLSRTSSHAMDSEK